MSKDPDLKQRLETHRGKIDEIDRKLVETLNERARTVVEIGRLKQDGVAPIYAPDRERRVLEQLRSYNKGPISQESLEAIWREIMSSSFALERRLNVGILGPAGSFSHLTARRKFGASIDYVPLESIPAVFDRVARSKVDMGIVPIENSLEGGITETLDSFLDNRVRICAEVLINIHHNLLAKCPQEQVTRIYSKPNGFSQCRAWLASHLRQAERVPVASTSRAAELAGQEQGTAAIGSSLAAELYGLDTLVADIEDDPNNTTRFLVISRESPPPTDDDKTAIMFTTAHKVGALASVLDVFRDRQLNLTHIDTRPSRRENWQYFFFVDLVGHEQDEHVRNAIEEARGHCLQLTVLGAFPRAAQVL